MNKLKNSANYVLLESIKKDPQNTHNLLFTDPVDIITCNAPKELQKTMTHINQTLKKGYYLAGFFSYELGYLFEKVLSPLYKKTNFPLIWLGVYVKPHYLKKPLTFPNAKDFFLSSPTLNISYKDYLKKITQIKNWIRQGDTYQVNFTTKYQMQVYGDILALYQYLRQKQSVSYTALIKFNQDYILSYSPELFYRRNHSKIIVKPMKGTAPKTKPQNWLKADPKNQSENVMIVDMLRNDLGKISRAGSVQTTQLFNVEDYETLWQMTSTIEGILSKKTTETQIIQNLFPSGSVTGAPKIKTMELIHQLEESPRNIYTGTIGYLSPHHQSIFNVAIRTLHLSPMPAIDQTNLPTTYTGELGVGGGIVYDSVPKEEFQECQLKAKFLTTEKKELYLIETMLGKNQKIPNLALHLNRLKKSAQYFKFQLNVEALKKTLEKKAKSVIQPTRIKLHLSEKGKITFEISKIIKPKNQNNTPKITISKIKTNTKDIFLYHKTSNRETYHQEYQKALKKSFFDVIFTNEKNEITEGAISNIFLKIKNHYITPPLSSGLLNGVERQLFIKKNKVKEKKLFPKDLQKAKEILLTNAIRGITKVVL